MFQPVIVGEEPQRDPMTAAQLENLICPMATGGVGFAAGFVSGILGFVAGGVVTHLICNATFVELKEQEAKEIEGERELLLAILKEMFNGEGPAGRSSPDASGGEFHEPTDPWMDPSGGWDPSDGGGPHVTAGPEPEGPSWETDASPNI